MASVAFIDLPSWQRDLIEDARILLGDLDEDENDRFFTDDHYAVLLMATARDFNRARPATHYQLESFPENLGAVLFSRSHV